MSKAAISVSNATFSKSLYQGEYPYGGLGLIYSVPYEKYPANCDVIFSTSKITNYNCHTLHLTPCETTHAFEDFFDTKFVNINIHLLNL